MKKEVLFINACVRGKEISRTYKIAKSFLDEYKKINPNDTITEIDLGSLKPEYLSYNNFSEKESLISKKEFTNPIFNLAKQFVNADRIVIAAPFWEFSFPTVLSAYFENVFIAGLAFKYTAEGSVGLCNAEKMIYFSTRGGDYSSPKMEENLIDIKHLKALCDLAGIKNFDFIAGDGLDIIGYNAEKIVNDCILTAKKKAETF